MKTTVYKRLATQFDMCGKVVSRPIEKTDAAIGDKLCNRLIDYAKDRARNIGIPEEVMSWSVEVYTLDSDSRVDDRAYTVRWSSGKGADIELCGILIRKGKPVLDHRFSLSED